MCDVQVPVGVVVVMGLGEHVLISGIRFPNPFIDCGLQVCNQQYQFLIARRQCPISIIIITLCITFPSRNIFVIASCTPLSPRHPTSLHAGADRARQCHCSR